MKSILEQDKKLQKGNLFGGKEEEREEGILVD